MQGNKCTLFCVLILCLALLCECGYAPTELEERGLEDCLLNGRSGIVGHSCRYYEKKFNAKRRGKRQSFCKYILGRDFFKHNKGSISKTTDDDPEMATEYLCALVDYNNLKRKTNRDIRKVTEGIGSCAYIFDSIIPTWKQFLNKRRDQGEPISPLIQHRRGKIITAKFAAADTIHRSVQDLNAVDLVVSRSKKRDVEVYGKYTASISLRSANDVFIPVHESIQSTCFSNFKRSFVLGFNDTGLQIVRERLADGAEEIELKLSFEPISQIIRVVSGGNHTYEANEFDIEEKVSAIVFNQINPNSNDFFRNSRPKRSASRKISGRCHRERYVVDYSKHERVMRPTLFDLGECVGSCDDALFTNLNSTNHALTMESEKRKRKSDSTNPVPTVCCIPTAYERFYYISRNSRGVIMSTYADNMVSKYCGCR